MHATAETKPEKEKQLIPLKDVWAYFTPGTQYIQKLNPSTSKDLVEPILQSLAAKSQTDDAPQGFVVQGNDKDALQKVYDVFVNRKPILKEVSPNEKTWVVFFSRDSLRFVYVREVLREPNHIAILYQFVENDSREMSRQIALIPLGTLPSGKYRVSVTDSTLGQEDSAAPKETIPASTVRKIVCRPFQFIVTDKKP
jgi:hypothetical protein